MHLDDEVYRVLVRLGVAEQFAAVSRPSCGLQLIDRNHRVLAVFDRAADHGRHGHPQANMFDQPELEHLLRTNLKDQPTVSLRGNVEVTEVAQDGQERVRVDFTDRLSGEHESVLAHYVLGCDGANSVVRTAIGSTMEDLKFEQRWLVIDVHSTIELDQWEGAHQVCDPDRAATYMRVGQTRYRWEFRLLEGETAADFESIEALQPLIGPWVEGIACDQLELVRVAEYTFRALLADRWRDRNVFLLGDAAHLTPPFIGQGLCAGVRDAMNLSWKIAGVVSGDLPESVLDTYEAERKPHARELIQLAKLIGAAMTQGGRAGDLLRRVIAPRLHWIPGLRERLLDSETPPLHPSALVERRTRRKSLNGRLCPNAILPDHSRLDDASTGGFMLISTVPPSSQQRAILADRSVRVVQTTAGSQLHDWLSAGHAAAALVRPDYTVMRAGRDLCSPVPGRAALPGRLTTSPTEAPEVTAGLRVQPPPPPTPSAPCVSPNPGDFMSTTTTAPSGRSRLWDRQLAHYPDKGPRAAYLAITVLATVTLYYQLYVQGAVATQVIQHFGFTFTQFVYVSVVGALVGAFASLAAGLADRFGRANLVVGGLLVTALLVGFVMPAADSKTAYFVIFALVSLVEGMALVATPALIRDFCPRSGADPPWRSGPWDRFSAASCSLRSRAAHSTAIRPGSGSSTWQASSVSRSGCSHSSVCVSSRRRCVTS